MPRGASIIGEDGDALYRGTRDAMVDGTWYAGPMNQRALEDLHAALAAHQDREVLFRVDPPRLWELSPSRALPAPARAAAPQPPPPPRLPLVLRAQGGSRG
jgi:hypothetical protein